MLEAIHAGRKRPGRALASVLLVEGLSGTVVPTLESLPQPWDEQVPWVLLPKAKALTTVVEVSSGLGASKPTSLVQESTCNTELIVPKVFNDSWALARNIRKHVLHMKDRKMVHETSHLICCISNLEIYV